MSNGTDRQGTLEQTGGSDLSAKTTIDINTDPQLYQNARPELLVIDLAKVRDCLRQYKQALGDTGVGWTAGGISVSLLIAMVTSQPRVIQQAPWFSGWVENTFLIAFGGTAILAIYLFWTKRKLVSELWGKDSVEHIVSELTNYDERKLPQPPPGSGNENQAPDEDGTTVQTDA